MSDQNDLSGKVGLDTTDFKAGISAMNRDLRVIESGFRASAASLGDWSKSATGLESRIKALTAQIEVQTKKSSALRSEYEKVAKEKGVNSKAAQELQIKLNKENETLAKMQTELKGTQTQLANMGKEEEKTKTKTTELEKEEKKATTTTNQFGSAMKSLTGHLAAAGSGLAHVAGQVAKVAAGLAVGLVAAATAAAVGLGALISKSIAYAGNFAHMSDVTGISTVRLQEMAYVGKALDVSLETISGSMSKLIRNMSSAKEGTGPAAEAFKALGISVTDMDGNLRSSEDVFNEAIAALSAIENPTERDAVAMALFGKSAMELNPLIKAGADEVARLTEQAHALGAVMTEEDVSALDNVGDSAAMMGQTFKGITGHLAAAFAPILQTVIDLLNNFVASPAVQAGLENLHDGISRIAKIMSLALTTDSPLDSVAQGLRMISGGEGILNTIAGALDKLSGILPRLKEGFASGGIGGLLQSLIPEGGVSGIISSVAPMIGNLISGLLTSFASKPAMLLQIGLDIISGLAEGLLTAIPALLPVFLQLITSLVNFITTSLPTLLQMGLEVLLALAMGIINAIPQLIPVVLQLINMLIQFIVTNLPMIITAAVQLIVTLAQGIAQALPVLIPTILGIIPGLILTLLENLPLLITAALEIILALVQGIIAALPVLIPEIPKIITTIIDIITENLPKVIEMALTLITTLVTAIIENLPLLVQAAIDIITALLDGIVEMLPELITMAGTIIDTLITALTDLIPSLLTAGTDLVDGLWQGIQDAWNGLLTSMSGLIAGLPEWVKKLLGIASPSKVFAEIGKNMAAGLGTGFQDSYKSIKKQIGQAVEGLSAQASMSVSGNLGVGGAGRQLQPVPINITIQGAPDNELDMRRLARYVANEIQRSQS